jgi:dienelactone hydrolase
MKDTRLVGLSLLLFMEVGLLCQQAELLPRRAYFGVGLEKHEIGARVFSVGSGSTAAGVGMAVGDVILTVDDQTISTPEAVVAAISRYRPGQSVRMEILRDGERRAIQATLKPLPFEEMKNATVEYSSVVASPGVRLRTIVSVPLNPSGGRFPAVLLIQGGGCGSIDAPFSSTVAQPGLVHAIGSQGFVTLRVEKSGVGDSQGPPCDSIGFKEELAGYQAALKFLQAHPSVDTQRVFLIGISLGGLFAPLLAEETKVAGISVYGTLVRPPPPYPGRSDRFFQEFSTVDIPAAWRKVATRVQVLHGEYDVDEVTSRTTHQSIAAIVNGAQSGSAEFKELLGLDHCWSRHVTLEASRDKCGQGDVVPLLSDTILEFLRAAGR